LRSLQEGVKPKIFSGKSALSPPLPVLRSSGIFGDFSSPTPHLAPVAFGPALFLAVGATKPRHEGGK